MDANGSYYDLLGTVIKGDLIYDSRGDSGLTGHTVIVAGSFYSSKFDQYYIRAVEAISEGVCYGIICDDRFEAQQSYLDRPRDASASKMKNALSFAKSQLGKPWKLVFTNSDYSENRKNWYCSLLAYAAYLNEGIEFNVSWTLGRLHPADLHDSSSLRTLVEY